MLTDQQIQEIRSHFEIFRRKTYLNSCSQGALSDVVQRGLEEYIASWQERGSPWDVWVERYEAARVAFAQFINASPDEVAIVTSASAGINGIASALHFRERKKVVLGEFEFPTMGHIWLAQRGRGAEVQFVPAAGHAIPAENYEKMVDRNTLLVPLTHVCFKNGFRSEINAIAQIAHASGALVMLDDFQDCGTRPVDVKATNLDFYVTGTLKYLLGPSGIAFLYVRKELISSLAPTVTGWFGQADPFTFNPQHFELSASARRFESGSPSVPNVYAAMPAIQWLKDIGLQNVALHIKQLTQALLGFARESGIRATTPSDSVGPLVVLQCKDSNALLEKLAANDVIVSNRHDGLRISFHVYNTIDDVKKVAAVLEKSLDLLVVDRARISYD
jgi:selenocysteine lyase/cysteine desulfurase